MSRIINTLYSCTDILNRITVDQLFHVRSCKSPVTINCLIAHGHINKIVTAASDRTDSLKIIKILKNRHQSGDTSLHRCFINNACLGKSILRHRRCVIGNHDGNGTSRHNAFILPLTGQVALHLSIHYLSLSDHSGCLRGCFRWRRCLSFPLQFKLFNNRSLLRFLLLLCFSASSKNKGHHHSHKH